MNRKRKNKADVQEPETKVIKKNDNSVVPTDALFWPFKNSAVLGRGGFGIVQLWYHHSKGSLFAGKSFKQDNDYIVELELVKKLNHDNVIKYIHSYDEQQTIIYDICSITLHELLTNRIENKMGLCQSMILKLIKDITSALDYLIHKLEIVHRDIKPSNVLYSEDLNRFILADFGLAIHFDSNTLQYEDIVCGTQEFIRPDLLQLASTKDKIKISISSEIWSLAITLFLAGTGLHPFQSKLRHKWIDYAMNRPDGCIHVTQEGEYKYTIDKYCRMSCIFKTEVFEPLLVFMMSKEPTFKDYFTHIERIRSKTTIHVFDINSFMLTSYDKDTFVNLATANTKQTKCIVHEHSLVTDFTRIISKSTETSPFVVFDYSKAETNKDVRTNLEHRIFKSFSDFFSNHSDKYDKDQARCVFTNALSTTNTILKQSDFILSVSELYIETLKKERTVLKVYGDCFENEIKQFFRMHVPKSEFGNIVQNLMEKIQSFLKVEDYEDFEKLDIHKLSDLATFQDNMSLLEQKKLSPLRQEHLLQVVKSMELSISSCLTEIVAYLDKFHTWFHKIKDRISCLESLINETKFALQELNKQLVNEITSISK